MRSKDTYEILCEVGERLDYDHREMLARVLTSLCSPLSMDEQAGTLRWLRDAGYGRERNR